MNQTTTSDVKMTINISALTAVTVSSRSASLQFNDWKGSVTLEVKLWRILQIKPTKELQ